ncbi:MAG TPA: class I SAM-dependent methyltransferase [Candidatus Bathyarchaeia archaeon]|nr:class I SAM-dependent methyltransferase [Candidatus Bathyarchaeia archaeon]
MKIVSDPADIESSWHQLYERLVSKVASILPARGEFIEVGCGKGQFTIPLLRKLPNCRIVAVDRFEGPYHGDRSDLTAAINRSRLRARVRIVKGDFLDWMTAQVGPKYDAVVSNDFVAEIDSKGLRTFLSECHRILKPGGISVHSFLSPKPQNRRQRRLIEADSNPKWTKDPPLEWFSPAESLVIHLLKLAHFKKVQRSVLRSELVFRSIAARDLLKSWGVRQSYWQLNRRILEREGLEVPGFSITSALKP